MLVSELSTRKGIGMFFDQEVYFKQRFFGFLGVVCLAAALSAPLLAAAGEPELPIVSAWNKQFGDGRLAFSGNAVSDGEVLEWKRAVDGSFSLARKDTAIPFNQFIMEEGMTLNSLMRDHQWRVRVARSLRGE